MTPLLIGCYTAESGGNGRSLVRTAVHADGSFEPVVAASDDVASPSFLARHPQLPVVYAASELDAGVLTTYDASSGRLSVLDAQSTGGSLPCHVAIDDAGKTLAVAGYGDGSLSIFTLDPAGIPGDQQVFHHQGTGPHPERQDRAHCHQVTFGVGISVSDLGADRIRRYMHAGDHWAAAAGGDVAVRKGSGPRHIAVDGHFRYVVDELQPGVTSYRVDGGTGRWEEVSRAAYTGDVARCLPSHVLLHKGFLYVANRGVDTMTVLQVTDGALASVAEVPVGGVWPRHFALIGDVLVVANQQSDSLTSLLLSADDPVPVLTSYQLATGSPTCILPLG